MTANALPAAVIRAEPDGYDLTRERLMGRQSAGNGFLRAAVQARGDRPIHGFTPSPDSARRIAALVKEIDPAAGFEWVPPERLQRVTEIGTLYTPGPSLAADARLRQRVGLAAYSICGVTHTTASLRAMDDIAALLREPLAPWDALVCTSQAVVDTVRQVHAAEAEYLRWRFGPQARPALPRLPVIPLGVHADDFAVAPGARTAARTTLGLAEDTVAILFVGRLVFHAKAHPYALFRALESAARQSGRRLALLLCGWFPNAAIEAAFRDGARDFAPGTPTIFLEGRDAAQRARAWAAADVFASLSDSIQETFGLTPLEAMAAGLPVVVSDWNGYRDTVREGVDGFRIATAAPAAGLGGPLIFAHESEALSYDQYCWTTTSSTAVDVTAAAQAIAALARDPELRRRLGEAGRRRARETFDWRVVYGQYQALWAELGEQRRRAAGDRRLQGWLRSLPRVPAARLDPFQAFAHYPTRTIDGAMRLAVRAGASRADLDAALRHALFGALSVPAEIVQRLFESVGQRDGSLDDHARSLGQHLSIVARAAGLLLKLGLVEAAS
ncbi:MAG: glycosyltransferase family 4 protein [Reyranellaceae bacterium]